MKIKNVEIGLSGWKLMFLLVVLVFSITLNLISVTATACTVAQGASSYPTSISYGGYVDQTFQACTAGVLNGLTLKLSTSDSTSVDIDILSGGSTICSSSIYLVEGGVSSGKYVYPSFIECNLNTENTYTIRIRPSESGHYANVFWEYHRSYFPPGFATCYGDSDCWSSNTNVDILYVVEMLDTCTDTTWTPDPSTVCLGTSFTQTSNCGTTRTATGTKTTGECCISNCSCASNTCTGQTCSDGCGGTCQGTKDCCAGVICNDNCAGNTRNYNGQCSNGQCIYDSEQCSSCSSGSCVYNNPPKIKGAGYSYDNYGNIIKISYLGDIGKNGDEKYDYAEYLYNTNDWIIDKPKHVYSLDTDNSTKVSEAWFRYDNGNYGQIPTKGDLTYKEYWLNTGSNPVEKFGYDSYGNIINHTNARGYIEKYNYDSTHTFLNKTINAKNHQAAYRYDVGTGNLLSVTGPNNYTTQYIYDLFGRKTKEIELYDSLSYPTKEIQYNLDGVSPEEIKVMERESSGTAKTYDSYIYYDGFSNAVQAKKESDGSQLITKDITYDALFRVKEEANPYYSSVGYTSPLSSVGRIIRSYDALGRATQVQNPDGTVKQIAYNHWNVTLFDENNKRKDFSYDSYGKIIYVKEYNDGKVYLTAYSYDPEGNLKEITDNQNNKIKYSYDSLGRKTKLQDPDMGAWNYSYDANSNLVRQIDNKGNAVYLAYDELDRIKTKNTSGIAANYYYDINKNGTLSKATYPGFEIQFWYDNRLRPTNEKKIIYGATFNISFSYDSMGRITSKTLPDGSVINYSYDNQGLVDSIGGILPNIDYNELDQQILRAYNNGMATTLQYNSSNYRLNRISTGGKQDLSYSCDKVGNVIGITDSVNSKTSSFSYDDLDRLAHAQRTSDFDINYSYDSIGNILNISSAKDSMIFVFNKTLAHAPFKLIYREFSIPLKEFKIYLTQGWNLVSLPLNATNTTISGVLNNISFKSIFSYNSSWLYYFNETKKNFNKINNANGWWVRTLNNQTLNVAGNDYKYPIKLNLKKGWNLVSYPSLNINLANESFKNVNFTRILGYDGANKKWLSYNKKMLPSFNTLGNMTPAQGYWVEVANNINWSFNGSHYINFQIG